MKFYLSSYKIGDESEKLVKLVLTENRRAAYIPNALDFSTDLERIRKHEAGDINELKNLGFEVERVDLRDYFQDSSALEAKIRSYGLLWISGGNTFVLRQAMKLSGFDMVIKRLEDTDIVYGGYSAGACVLAPTLKGLDIVDDPNAKPYGEQYETIWEGLDRIEYTIAPHYDSDHPESEDVNKEIQYCTENNIPYKPLRDGEVIIIDTNS